MRLFTACLGTETHTGGPLPTDLRSFEETYLVRGGAHPEGKVNMFGVPLVMWRERAEARGWEVVESVCGFATPSGMVVRRVYEDLRDEILRDLKAAMPVDGVMLSLHGAMVVEGYGAAEGDLVERIRAIIGPDVPMTAEFDLHCHLSKRLCDGLTALVIYKEYPHTDFAARAEEMWRLMEGKLDGTLDPVMSVHDCRMVGLFHTTREPMRGYVDRMAALEGKGSVLSVSLGHGFPWGDVLEEGARVVVVTNGDKAGGDALAEKLGRELWDMRDDITPVFSDMETAITDALGTEGGPVVLADMSDNPGGGAPGDSTFIVRRLLERGIGMAAVGGIWDPMAAAICLGAGEGATIDLRLGGKTGPTSGDPLDLRVTVRKVILDHTVLALGGSKRYMGDTVWVSAEGIDFIIHAARCQNTTPNMFTDLGIDITEKKILVVKSMQHFHAAYAPLAARVIYVAAPGTLIWDMREFPYEKLARPVWPLDADPWTSNAEREW